MTWVKAVQQSIEIHDLMMVHKASAASQLIVSLTAWLSIWVYSNLEPAARTNQASTNGPVPFTQRASRIQWDSPLDDCDEVFAAIQSILPLTPSPFRAGRFVRPKCGWSVWAFRTDRSFCMCITRSDSRFHPRMSDRCLQSMWTRHTHIVRMEQKHGSWVGFCQNHCIQSKIYIYMLTIKLPFQPLLLTTVAICASCLK